MANSSTSLDKWRDYFRTANSDIFDILEHAILVAASDCPYELKLKRDRIAEMLFTCKNTKCFGCDRIELAVPNKENEEKSDDEKCKSGVDANGSKDTKESKVNSNGGVDDHGLMMVEKNVNVDGNLEMKMTSNCSYDQAEALTDEIEEESQVLEDVWRIKEDLDNSEEQSATFLFDLLRKLQLMPLTIEILTVTQVGKSVSNLRKHESKEIRNLVRTMIKDWKLLVDTWTASAAVIEEAAMESVKTSAVQEEGEGLPHPPLDEGCLFSEPMFELSKFFDEMDEAAMNLDQRNGGEFKNQQKRKVELPTGSYTPPWTTPKYDHEFYTVSDTAPKSIPNWQHESDTPPSHNLKWRQETPNESKRSTPPSDRGSSTRPQQKKDQEKKDQKQEPEVKPRKSWLKINKDEPKVQQNPVKASIQRKPVPAQQDNKARNNEELSVRAKLEVAKRKLQERYQQAENAKKQRTIQVVELNEIPKQSVVQRNQQMRPGNHNRHRPNGRW